MMLGSFDRDFRGSALDVLTIHPVAVAQGAGDENEFAAGELAFDCLDHACLGYLDVVPGRARSLFAAVPIAPFLASFYNHKGVAVAVSVQANLGSANNMADEFYVAAHVQSPVRFPATIAGPRDLRGRASPAADWRPTHPKGRNAVEHGHAVAPGAGGCNLARPHRRGPLAAGWCGYAQNDEAMMP